MVRAIGETYTSKKLIDLLSTLTTGQAAEEKRHLNVFIGRDLGKQVEVLEDETHPTVADPCQFLPAQT